MELKNKSAEEILTDWLSNQYGRDVTVEFRGCYSNGDRDAFISYLQQVGSLAYVKVMHRWILWYRDETGLELALWTDTGEQVLLTGTPGSRLKEARTRAGISQKELAEQVGVSVRLIQDYEQDHKPLAHARAASVVAIGRVLGVTCEELLGIFS